MQGGRQYFEVPDALQRDHGAPGKTRPTGRTDMDGAITAMAVRSVWKGK